MYKLSRPQVRVSTVVGSWKTHNNSETHFTHTHTHIQVSLTKKPLKATPTGSAAFLKEFPDMSFSAQQGHTEDNHSSPSPGAHSTTQTESSAPSRDKRPAPHTFLPGAPPFPGCHSDAALQRKGSRDNTKGQKQPHLDGRENPVTTMAGMIRKLRLTEHPPWVVHCKVST